jgi:molybdopterin converting factor small subunit
VVIGMANVTVTFEGTLVKEIGVARIYISGETVVEVLEKLFTRVSALRNYVSYNKVVIALNGQNIKNLHYGENTKLADFDVLRIVRSGENILISSPVSINDMKKIKPQ